VISTVIVNPNPTVTVNSGSICLGNSFVIIPAGATVFTVVGTLPVVTPTVAGTYYYTIIGETTGSCRDTATSTVIVINLPNVMASTVKSMICAGETATLLAMGAASYSWSSGGTGSPLVISPPVTAGYSVTGTSALGCTAVAVVTQSVSTCDGIPDAGEMENFSLYPNPNTGSFFIEAPFGDKLIRVTDISGREIYSSTFTGEKEGVDLSAYAKGFYYVQVTMPAGQKTFKVLIH
jgi:hypothetical protein